MASFIFRSLETRDSKPDPSRMRVRARIGIQYFIHLPLKGEAQKYAQTPSGLSALFSFCKTVSCVNVCQRSDMSRIDMDRHFGLTAIDRAKWAFLECAQISVKRCQGCTR
jgi:hypothetical protein